MSDLRYPLGPMPTPLSLSEQERSGALAALGALPQALRASVEGLSDAQLDTPYREEGWTVRQVVHHVADSHLNAYVRTKLALTEDNPGVRPYDETLWAELPDARLPVGVSLDLLESLHRRWVASLEGVSDWGRPWTHPAQGRTYTLDTLLGMYAWHGRHHIAHVTGLRGRQGW
ncbi:YfiT family bacillithiol transferase [Deinococcus deserti]|uniref:Putative metal-dependent hydrolase Deide_18520 n=1 Tax=Deinococcus deserti (strain DSM 17065 / CIP 109153 / LMG 22923 / VCD115) TaxID=546414 RepID=C1CXC3_DEIDV|nr:putative metal-dependent hydrolase [Deinococcus deserti]ACO46840.1 putative metal-dependent hydrolase [Deinococcus deserti VCD115]